MAADNEELLKGVFGEGKLLNSGSGSTTTSLSSPWMTGYSSYMSEEGKTAFAESQKNIDYNKYSNIEEETLDII